MLIQQKLETLDIFSSNEKEVAQFLLFNKENIKHLSITEISKRTFTSPSTTVRLAQKLGYDGWKELKEAFYEEIKYLKSHFHEIDPNIPFTKTHTLQDISGIIASLLKDAIQDTHELLHHDDLQKAVLALNKADNIYIFAITNTASITYDFQYKMKYLYKKVHIIDNPELFAFTLPTVKKDDCCLFISYSGETFEIFRLGLYLRKRHFTAISITSIGDNSLLHMTDYHLYIATREKLSSKIGHYVSNESIHYILDVLYSCLFSLDYQNNMELKLKITKEIDFERSSSTSILQEDDS